MNKINWKTLLLAILIILMVANLTALITFFIINKKASLADRDFRHPGKEARHHFHEFMMKDLKLTDKQFKDFEKIRDEYIKSGKDQVQLIKALKDSIFTEIVKENPDTLKIKSFSMQAIQAQEVLMTKAYTHILEVKKVLNKEQQEKFFRFLNHKIPGINFPFPKEKHYKHSQPAPCNEPPCANQELGFLF